MKPNRVNASRTKLSPTPCIDVFTNLTLHVSLVDLGHHSQLKSGPQVFSLPVGDELRKFIEISFFHFSCLVYKEG